MEAEAFAIIVDETLARVFAFRSAITFESSEDNYSTQAAVRRAHVFE